MPSPNPNPTSSVPPPPNQWEAAARAWLSSFQRPPPAADVDAWIDSNLASLPPDLHLRLLSLRVLPIPNSSESVIPQEASWVEHPYRFQRTSLWKPAYSWLESLETGQIVQPEQIAGWLADNPEVKESLFAKHPRHHLIMMHYIQKLHMKVLKKRGKLPKGMHLSAVKASVRALNGGIRRREIPFPSKISGNVVVDKNIMFCKKKEAFLRYQLLTDLQNQLASFLPEQKAAVNSPLIKQMSEHRIIPCSSNAVKKDGSTGIVSGGASHYQEMVKIHLNEQVKPTPDTLTGQSKKRNPVAVTSAWSDCEALHGMQVQEHLKLLDLHVHIIKKQRHIIQGMGMLMLCVCKGWRSFGIQFEGPAVWFNRRSYSSWVPTWCAYKSSVATVQPFGRQGVQKVLDVRFHPEGLPQLVCSSNETPNELLLYNLLSGRATQLNGHNCQVTKVSFSSCGTYFNASSTSNSTIVWNIRLMPMTRAQLPVERSHPSSDTRFIKPLHCLSHGKQMPTAELAGQLPGHVDVGDQGVNDARWLRREPVLVTASGDGSIAMWDVTLGQPCVRHFSTHSRCANTVTVAPNDEYLCSGGDDQKVVYHNGRGSSNKKWRLTHPLSETE